MKKSKVNRFLAVGVAAAMTVSMSSCGEKTDSSSPKKTAPVETADKVVTNAYRAEEVDAPFNFTYLYGFERIGDTDKVVIQGYDDSEIKVIITDFNFDDVKEIDLGLVNDEHTQSGANIGVGNDGSIFSIRTVIDYGDFELPDYEDPDFDGENFDYEAMEEAAVSTYYIDVFDSEGNKISENEVKDLDKLKESDGDYLYFQNVFPLDDNRAMTYVSGNREKFCVLNTDGSVGDGIDIGENVWVNASCIDNDGNIAFTTWGDNGLELKFIDVSTLKLKEDSIELSENINNAQYMFKGTGDYQFYLSGRDGLYGIKSDGVIDEIVNWVDSDLNGEYITSVIGIENDEFLIYENNWGTSVNKFYRLTRRDASELENTVILKLAVTYADDTITNKITEFNKTNGKYRIKLEDYSQYYEWDEENEKQTNTPENQFKMDIVSGKTPDMIYFEDDSLFTNLSSKGVLVDLNNYLSNGDLSKDDLMSCVLDGCEYEGKLTSLPLYFYLRTCAVKSKFFDKENWTLDELIDTYDSLPDGVKLLSGGSTKSTVFSFLSSGCNEFLDYSNGTCSFDSPEFIKLLEFSNTFYNEGEGDEIDWETATDEMINEYWEEQDLAFVNDSALIDPIYIYSPRTFLQAKYGYFNEEMTLAGYPSDNEKGGNIGFNGRFAIMNTSANQDACWDFISSFFNESQYSDYTTHGNGLPVLKSAFECVLDECMEDPYYLDQDGEKVTYKDQLYFNSSNTPIDIPNLTKEERDYIYDYILNSTKCNPYFYDMDISPIIDEEVEVYFKGERTAQETAEIIQNRVSILISEQN